MKRTIYLANPYGFSAQQRAVLLPQIVAVLEALGLEVWEPFERNNQVDISRPGVPPDEGVMVELGMAVALGKPTFLFRDDFRRATDSEEYPLNLMLFTGMPRQGWQSYYYTSIAEIGSPEKALARWAKG